MTKGADCEPQIDRVERVKDEFPGVNFAVVMSGDERKEVEQIASNRHWTQPVGVDQDGAVVNLYGIGVCPSTVFSYRRRQRPHDEARKPHRGPDARAGAGHPETAAPAEAATAP